MHFEQQMKGKAIKPDVSEALDLHVGTAGLRPRTTIATPPDTRSNPAWKAKPKRRR
ncbi:hypothetical protein [Burkholderia ubonensis]|uniref:hypothetical protein n=1 Tax=Burkholderia ubonensis TaxID=101571 RepID=UPI000A8334C4|nr:hypothetical protein [Burkholderia ubonensis]